MLELGCMFLSHLPVYNDQILLYWFKRPIWTLEDMTAKKIKAAASILQLSAGKVRAKHWWRTKDDQVGMTRGALWYSCKLLRAEVNSIRSLSRRDCLDNVQNFTMSSRRLCTHDVDWLVGGRFIPRRCRVCKIPRAMGRHCSYTDRSSSHVTAPLIFNWLQRQRRKWPQLLWVCVRNSRRRVYETDFKSLARSIGSGPVSICSQFIFVYLWHETEWSKGLLNDTIEVCQKSWKEKTTESAALKL